MKRQAGKASIQIVNHSKPIIVLSGLIDPEDTIRLTEQPGPQHYFTHYGQENLWETEILALGVQGESREPGRI
jgi:hypothetical protein